MKPSCLSIHDNTDDSPLSGYPRVLTVEHICECFHCGKTTARGWCREGKLPCFKIGQYWGVLRSELEKFILAGGSYE
ncbi:MAG: helix-turn-helix domain-containing protein [Coriobacteriales bacterium]|nr:helix-turn-helix domain-containing protein [Coriobacteriales bacterium]